MIKRAFVNVKNRVVEVCRNIKGQAMAEYGLLLFFIAVLVIAVLVILGPQIAAVFQSISAQLP